MSTLHSKPWRRASVSINLDAVAHNLQCVRKFSPGAKVMAVIKANAYGHGMLAVAEKLIDADSFAVAMPQEAYALRGAGCNKTIVVLHGFCDASELAEFSRLNLSSVIHHQSQLDCLLETKLASPIDTWLKVDTGMHRLGFSVEKTEAVFGQLRNTENVKNVFLMSHFANADDVSNSLNNNQLESFIKVTNDIDVDCSMANSAAIASQPRSHFEIVRPGIMLYGSSPLIDVSAEKLGLQSAMQFESSIISVKSIKAGEAIGYGSTYICEHETRLGIVAAGYADGYPRHAKTGTPVWVNNQQCRLLGRVSMDSLCIDLTEVEANIGDRVVLWGRELSVDLVAQKSDSISYQLLCNAGAANLL